VASVIVTILAGQELRRDYVFSTAPHPGAERRSLITLGIGAGEGKYFHRVCDYHTVHQDSGRICAPVNQNGGGHGSG
jgi:hypothetical protein